MNWMLAAWAKFSRHRRAGIGSDIDYAQVIKDYGVEASEDGSPTARRYSPNKVKSIEVRKINGDPDEDHITTSHVERMNLTIRMGMRRYTRLTCEEIAALLD